ncbi:MAG TPA: tail fiber domain-containing protein [Acidiferrobacterales bacterium]
MTYTQYSQALILGSVLAVLGAPAGAGEVTLPNTFTAGTPAVAAQVNANFDAVKAAVDDNNGRINTLEGVNAGARLNTLETNAASPGISGNITLVPSTATAGNILKGVTPFLHDYGHHNTFLGENAGNFTMSGVANTAVGSLALNSNTSGLNNTAIGYAVLNDNTTGHSNTAIGAGALLNNTTGVGNTANGAVALSQNTFGTDNTAIGHYALYANNGGSNTAIGRSALAFNTSGGANTASGYLALVNNTTGSSNTALGFRAGYNFTTGNNNIAIDNEGVAGESNTIRIGDIQTRAFIAGIRGVTTATAAIPVYVGTDGQLGTVSSSRRVKDNIADMGKASEVLMQLRPVTFHYQADRNPKGRTLQYGLIAEEVAEVAPDLVARTTRGEIETVYYQHLAPMLLNEYQKQQRSIAAQAALLQKQTTHITALERDRQTQTARLAALEQEMLRMTAALTRLQQPERLAAVDR